ncbi:hypothetical protein AGMMS4952_25060 [Spirochaetia bacterium]|nr:hypothetical protein AGMMS4952_25060 [Spirochaetia bacterium]
MRMKRNVIPVLALITAALVGVGSLGLTGCDIDSGTNTGGTTDTVVDTLNLTALVTAPVKGAAPQATFAEQAQYTGTIAWKTNADADHTGAFAAATVYKAVVTLTAKTGYTLTGVAANSFTHSGGTVTNAANSGTVTITFPATGAAGGVDAVVTALALDTLVTAPVKDVTPVTTAINQTQYTGTIAWKTNAGAAHTGAFAAGAVYKAEVTLTAESGFTFTGVTANSFTYSGATAVTNAANSGTVTITFPETAAAGSDTIINALSLDALVTAPAKDATPVTTAINQTQYTGTIAWKTSAGGTHTGAFAASTVYSAEVTLTPTTGYTFTGVTADSFTYTGATTVTNAANSGTVTITFPATAAADVVVTDLNLTTLVTAPAKDASPVATTINQTQYTGSIAWKTSAGVAHSGAFAAGAVYSAEVTLTPTTGYTFTGVTADSFTYTGATTVANAVNSGTVTITFPATAAADAVVTDLNLTTLVTAPAKDASPITTAINETQYTGSIAWKTNAGAAYSGAFAASTVYKAEVTLTAKTGYTFTGVVANSFTYTSAAVTNAVNSGTVTITFPATAAADVVVTDLNLTTLVTAPAKDASPVTTAINETQYTGSIAWKTNAGAAHSGAFAASTVYKAEVTLTPKTGYTFTGVAADSFTYTSATVTNAVNSGTVTITFPATAEPTGTSTVAINLWTDDTTAFASPASVTLHRATFETAIITGLSGADGYSNHQWSVNGSDVPAPAGTATTFTFSSLGKSDGTYNVELRVQKNSIWYSTTITITVEI